MCNTMKTDCFTTELGRWQAVVDRDGRADGAFVYAVATTGIYCRPGCPSRLPNRDNVLFFNTWRDAETAGFRPCKRCTPHLPTSPDTATEVAMKACRISNFYFLLSNFQWRHHDSYHG